MSDTYRLYDLHASPFCLKARICLSLKRVPYEIVTLTIPRLPELRRLNPLGKVPVLVANGRPIADSSQIARFLEETFPRPTLLPKDPVARAYCHVLEEWADESLSFIIGGCKWLNPANRERADADAADLGGRLLPTSLVRALARRRVTRRYGSAGFNAQSLPHLHERIEENLRYLRDLLADNSFLLGKYATLADLSVFAQLFLLVGYEEARLLEAVPSVQKWMEQIEALDEVQQAIRGESPTLATETDSAAAGA